MPCLLSQCFPGGRQEEEDGGDDVQTALRETHEEVGLASDCIDPICRLATMESVNGLCVTPIVAYLKEFQMEQLVLCQQEVEAAFAVPLSYFSEERNCASKEEIEWKGNSFVMRTFFFEDPASGRTFKIWGLTAAIVYQVAQIAMLDEGEIIDQPLMEAAKETTDSSKTTKGSLMRLQVSSSGKTYWSKRFFVKSGDMLHQYDSEEHASRKSLSATKKNRLKISDCQVSMPTSIDQHQEYTFSVSVLGGRIEWTLAASSETERSKWIAALQ
jgi:8-oxo-dGTP pyrophosphatase MutT (NUDIX family)